jgi:hypothetical protein
MTLYKKGDEYLRIEIDSDPESPREWDNLGTIATWHRRYTLGDEQPTEEAPEFTESLPKGTIKLPVYMYDHSGLTLSTKAFSCPWDSGQLGIIYATPARIEEMGVALIDVGIQLQNEIETYNQYVCGDVYGFTRFKEVVCETCKNCEEEVIDSCWGFFGCDHEASGLLEAAGIEDLEEWEEQM